MHDLPILEPAGERDRVYAVVTSPILFNSGQFLSVREVFWKQNQVTLRIDIWRDDRARMSNAPEFPVLIIPLELPRAQKAGTLAPVPGQYTAKAEFTPLRAPSEGRPYSIDTRSRNFRNTQVEFTIR